MTKFSAGRVERVADDTVVIHSSLGKDFVRICVRHRWASSDRVLWTDLPACPHCEMAKDSDGFERFNDLQLRLMPVEARP